MDHSSDLICLCYVSTARHDLPPEELSSILSGSMARNKARGITGMLCVSGRNFMQFLEGRATEIAALYEKIADDPRHSGCLVLFRSPVEQRAFPDWSMALRQVDQLAPESRDLYRAIETISLLPAAEATHYQKQLDTLFRSFILCMSQPSAA